MLSYADHIARADRAAQVRLGGTTVTYAPGVGAPVSVTGIFDEAYAHVQEGGAGIESVGPSVRLMLADLPLDPANDTPLLTIGGVVYRPHTRIREGMGAIRLLLHRNT